MDLDSPDWEELAGQVFVGTPVEDGGSELYEAGIDGIAPTIRSWIPAGSGNRVGMDRRWSLDEMGVGGLDEVYLRFKVHMPDEMIVTNDGAGDKLTGMFGKGADESPFNLAHGGNRPGDSWSVRPIVGGLGSVGPYFYTVSPNSNDPYGTALYRSKLGKGWNEIMLHYRMNTPGVANGVLRMWSNGVMIYAATDVEYRDESMAGIDISLMVVGFGSTITAAMEMHYAAIELLVPA